MSDDWIINGSRFEGCDWLQCPRNLQAQQLICVLYHIRPQGIFSISMKNWSNLCDLFMVSCFSWKNTRLSRSCSFSSFLFRGKNILAFKKIAVLCIQSIKFISLWSVYISILKTFLVAATLVYGHAQSPFHSDLIVVDFIIPWTTQSYLSLKFSRVMFGSCITCSADPRLFPLATPHSLRSK